MAQLSGIPDSMEFSEDWVRFAEQLSAALGDLEGAPAGTSFELHYPESSDLTGRVRFVTTVARTSDIGMPPRGEAQVVGVRIELPGAPDRFSSSANESQELADAARDVCDFLRDRAAVLHPSLLTVEADGIGAVVVEYLGLRVTSPAPIPDAVAQVVVWPRSLDETASAVEKILVEKYGSVNIDDDGDYVIDIVDGARFFVTLVNDRPNIMFRTAVVIDVNSRQSATVEANYLNRDEQDVRWVLRAHVLFQELTEGTSPFVPSHFAMMLDRFGELFQLHASSLRMRLGRDE